MAASRSSASLALGEVRITRAWDPVEGKIKAPKTDEGIRSITIPSTLRPLLERLTKDAGPETLLAPCIAATVDTNRANVFRAQLVQAGVTRAELHEDTATHERIDFRSIRDTGITWGFPAGEHAEVVQREPGHEKLVTTFA